MSKFWDEINSVPCPECECPGNTLASNGNCNKCGGSGVDCLSECERCNGSGECPRCNGTGWAFEDGDGNAESKYDHPEFYNMDEAVEEPQGGESEAPNPWIKDVDGWDWAPSERSSSSSGSSRTSVPKDNTFAVVIAVLAVVAALLVFAGIGAVIVNTVSSFRDNAEDNRIHAQFEGDCSYTFDFEKKKAQIFISKIVNTNPDGHTGKITVALFASATPQPYKGGEQDGVQLCSFVLGPLDEERCWLYLRQECDVGMDDVIRNKPYYVTLYLAEQVDGKSYFADHVYFSTVLVVPPDPPWYTSRFARIVFVTVILIIFCLGYYFFTCWVFRHYNPNP